MIHGGVMIVKMNAAKYDVAANSTNGKLKQFSPNKINGFPQVLPKCIQTFVGRNETRRLVLSMVMMNQSTLSSLCTCCLCPLMTDSDGIIECP